MEDIKVSVSCLVYNHEKYLRQCLDSLLMQETNFKYEILIHDDASTDGSADIIREYESKFPDIIKPIYQTENQYSKQVQISWTYQYPRARGKYLAWCEGDDFWSDKKKLQKQYDIMEKNSDCSFCVHTVRYVKENGEITEKVKPYGENQDCKKGSIQMLKTIFYQNVCPYQTSSFFARREYVTEEIEKIPEFISKCRVGDVPLIMLFSSKGSVYYIAEEMSCYRMFSMASWSRKFERDQNKKIAHLENLKDCIKNFDEYTSKRYSEMINYKIKEIEFNILRLKELYREMISSRYKEQYKKLNAKEKIYYKLFGYFPNLYKRYKEYKNR